MRPERPGGASPRCAAWNAVVAVAFAAASAAGCTATRPAAAPSVLMGAFEDDYGIGYTVTPSAWTQQPGGTYAVVRWDARARTALVRRTGGPLAGTFSRIDWVALPPGSDGTRAPDGGAPFAWAFCYAAYDVPTLQEARQAPASDRSRPRTGCGGHPFSRMRPR